MNQKVKITLKEDDAVISVEGYDVTNTVKLTEVAPEAPPIHSYDSEIDFQGARLQ